jgi:YbbR domain-containing protein
MIASALKNFLLFLLALALSVLVWVIAQVEQNPETQNVIASVPIEIHNVPSGLEVSSIDQTTVNLFVNAPQNVWSTLDNRSFGASVDLSGRDAGTYDISVTVTSREQWTRVLRTTPMYVSVKLERMKQKVVPVVVSVLDDAPAGYSMGAAVVTPTQVLISGRQSVVDQVTEAVAFLRVEGARSDILRPARPVLRDGRGSELQGNITVVPDTVNVSVPIFQLLGYKTVAMRAVITGTVASGYRLTSIVVEPQTLTLGGDPRTLEQVGYIDTSPVDISGARSDVTKPARFILPPGVATDRKGDVFVNVKVEPIPGQEIIRRPVIWVNLDKGLRVIAPLSPTIDLELSGPLADLTNLNSSDITVTVNLFGVVPGVIERVPVVTGLPKSLTIVRVVPEKFLVLIEAVSTPTPTATPTPTPLPARTATPTATPTPAAVGGG